MSVAADERTLTEWIREAGPRIEAALDAALPADSEPPPTLHRAMRYAVFGGGKRLRPLCTLLGARAAGGDEAAALPAACAIELVHSYSLVHDDLPCMDDDDVRRGRPTVHRAFDEAIAVLAGDALLTLAFEVVASRLPAPTAGRVAAELARAAGSRGMVGGQADDLDAEGDELARDAVLSIDSRKTAALFSAAFRTGAICAGAPRPAEEALARIGFDLGVAFQIVDDLLDLRGTQADLGKAAGKDRARGKATLPAAAGEAAAFEEARTRTAAAIEASAGLAAPRLIEQLAESMLNRSH
jgi:geranylgeranyl diphosphate synthase type II